MGTLKHIGKVSNTGLKCIVVFREIYDEQGHVIDPDHCLVVETERLPDMEHDDVVRVVESQAGQESKEFYEIAMRSRFADGTNMLNKLHSMGYLRKYPTNQIDLTPNPSTVVKLSEVNEIIRKSATGMSQRDIANSMVDDTDSPPREASNSFQPDPSQTIDQAVEVPSEKPMDDTAIAQSMLAQAETFLAEAERLKSEAYEMAPDLKPKRGRKKANANS